MDAVTSHSLSSGGVESAEPYLDDYETAWQSSRPPELRKFFDAVRVEPHVRPWLLVELVKLDLEFRWRRWGSDQVSRPTTAVGGLPARPQLEDYARLCPELGPHVAWPADLIAEEYRVRIRWGDRPSGRKFVERFPESGQRLMALLAKVEKECARERDPRPLTGEAGRRSGDPHESTSDRFDAGLDSAHTPHTISVHQLPSTNRQAGIETPRRRPGEPHPTEAMPEQFGRYRLERLLGEGGFGKVYLARDLELKREVAVKVPQLKTEEQIAAAEKYLAEARALAQLDHPGIVPVYDVGRTESGLSYVVSKYIPGRDLHLRLREGRPPLAESARIVAAVADALAHAHSRGLVHRDVKPANILLDKAGRPYVSDFGSALREEDFGKGVGFAGTPAYMSPEQARGEGHRVDGRSDVFSLGVILYELLTGRRPFRGSSHTEVLEKVAECVFRPLRQLDAGLPRELERICQRAMCKRSGDRYATALEMADDLRHFLAVSPDFAQSPAPVEPAAPGVVNPATIIATPTPGTRAGVSDSTLPVHVVPKGLRAFDAADADFFLELLPGPRDRLGLPDSLRFWKSRLESQGADEAFPIAVLFGPSGCGKTSLVKAGLLPRLARHVVPVYLEASPEIETQLLQLLTRRFPELAPARDLAHLLMQVRLGRGPRPDEKLVIVLDQFEQCLTNPDAPAARRLVEALRQCDGLRVQVLILVRDDFWMAATRFLQELEIPLQEGRNAMAVDLFDVPHAEKLLRMFGRALGTLPRTAEAVTSEQEAFVKQAVAGLAEEDKVVCVRLALFADMMKGRTWVPETLRRMGGTAGVGFTFLEETFSAPAALPERRAFESAARGVLRALLPEHGGVIKGHRRSRSELQEAAGLTRRPAEFAALLRLLDFELRLITPAELSAGGPGPQADPYAQTVLRPDDVEEPPRADGGPFYQLTHDYLVPSIRSWLTRRQQTTPRGRAELLLAERTTLWQTHPAVRYLPTFREWLRILFWTQPRRWSGSERTMMHRANRHHAFGAAVVASALVLLLAVGGLFRRSQIAHLREQVAQQQVDRLLDADVAQVPQIVQEVRLGAPRIRSLLKERLPEVQVGSARWINGAVALVAADPALEQPLLEELHKASPKQVRLLREGLALGRARIVPQLWAEVLEGGPSDVERRLRAAAALSYLDPRHAGWETLGPQAADWIVARNSLEIGDWVKLFEEVEARLQDRWLELATDPDSDHLLVATSLLIGRRPRDVKLLQRLLLDADAPQFAMLLPALKQKDNAVELLPALIDVVEHPPVVEPAERRTTQVLNAALALVHFQQTDAVWPLLIAGADPTLRNRLIHAWGPRGAPLTAVWERLERTSRAAVAHLDPTLDESAAAERRALLLLLGELGPALLSSEEQPTVARLLLDIFESDRDPGVHGAAEWALRRLKREHSLQETLARAPKTLRWEVDPHGRTWIKFPGPTTFRQGSPDDEPGREEGETLREVTIPRHFALCTREVTVAEFQEFLAANRDVGHVYVERFAPDPECPQVAVNWFQATAFCRWLSEQDGIAPDQMCYPTPAEFSVTRTNPADALQRTGYRLPTEAEWEYACRAGTTTPWSFGSAVELSDHYAWSIANAGDRTHPGGRLMPNDFGLCDLHGNVDEWCHVPFVVDQTAPEFTDDGGQIDVEVERALRGGTIFRLPRYHRSSARHGLRPQHPGPTVGFRLARTLP